MTGLGRRPAPSPGPVPTAVTGRPPVPAGSFDGAGRGRRTSCTNAHPAGCRESTARPRTARTDPAAPVAPGS
ncbi:hypothetical protein ATKI12_6718 [Kitasatospora sp. Ki12]